MGFVYFYGLHALLIGIAFVDLAIEGTQSSVGALVALVGATLLPWIAVPVSLGVLYGLIALFLWVSTRINSAVASGVTALFSLLLQLPFIFGFLVLVENLFEVLVSSTQSTGTGVTTKGSSYQSLPDSVTQVLTLVLIVLLVDCAIWLILLIATTVRSIRALASSFRTVPGVHRYGYGTTVVSSSQSHTELGFLESALGSSLGRFYSNAAELEDIYDPENYLVRFLHRNGQVLAASIQGRADRRLMAIFPGKDSAPLNTAILLEDSYIIQKAKRPVAQATLKRDSVIQSAAESAGWHIDADYDGLLELRRE